MIDAIHDAWTLDADMLTFEFANEPWCGGAWGLPKGVTTNVEGNPKVLALGDLDNAFHDLSQYLLVDSPTPLDFRGHALIATPMVSDEYCSCSSRVVLPEGH